MQVLWKVFILFSFLLFGYSNIIGCTIAVINDSSKTLFLNNEDFANDKTRIWFVPSEPNCFGCVYVGFDNGWAQGGLNTQGLAFDWVSGYNESYTPNKDLVKLKGNPSERMLETCSNVDEAITFFKRNLETSFNIGRIMIADSCGNSVIISAKNGEIYFDKSKVSRGFGFCGQMVNQMLDENQEANLLNSKHILKECKQNGMNPTRYSNVFDLKTGDIFLFHISGNNQDISLNLNEELRKGAHYYDIPHILDQMDLTPKPLLFNMRRHILYEFKPLVNQDLLLSKKIIKIITDAKNGEMNSNDYNVDFWNEIKNDQKKFQNDLKELGEIDSIYLIDKNKNEDVNNYRFVIIFRDIRIIQYFEIGRDNKISRIKLELAGPNICEQ